MVLKVHFQEYYKSEIDPDTGREERGEFMGSFSQEIEGLTIVHILDIAESRAKQYSENNSNDTRVECTVKITPR